MGSRVLPEKGMTQSKLEGREMQGFGDGQKIEDTYITLMGTENFYK